MVSKFRQSLFFQWNYSRRVLKRGCEGITCAVETGVEDGGRDGAGGRTAVGYDELMSCPQ